MQGHWRALEGLESEVQVEGFCQFVLRIHNQRAVRDLLSSLQAAVDRATRQQLAQDLAAPVCSARKPVHAKARHRKVRQLLALGFAQALAVRLRRAQPVVPQNALGLRRFGEHVDRTDAAPAALIGKATGGSSSAGTSHSKPRRS